MEEGILYNTVQLVNYDNKLGNDSVCGWLQLPFILCKPRMVQHFFVWFTLIVCYVFYL